MALSDPGGKHGPRVARMAVMAVAGALLTALGFGIGAGAWGWVMLAAFLATLLGGLAVKYGAHRFVAAYLLNAWFIIALGLPTLDLLRPAGPVPLRPDPRRTVEAGAGLAGRIGAVDRLRHHHVAGARGGQRSRSLSPRFPGISRRVKLTRPIILFAVIRAVAVSIAVAIAFGLQLPDADWMPDRRHHCHEARACSNPPLVAEQRVAGTILGAAVALLVLLAVDNRTALEVIIVVLLRAGRLDPHRQLHLVHRSRGRRAVLIAADVPHPTNLTDEGRRILFTFAGVGIAVIVMLLAGLLQKHAAKAAPQAPAHPARAG